MVSNMGTLAFHSSSLQAVTPSHQLRGMGSFPNASVLRRRLQRARMSRMLSGRFVRRRYV
jgi:hypothetical protein